MLGPWMYFMERLAMCLFTSLLLNMKAMSWCWCPPLGKMSGRRQIADNWWREDKIQVPKYCEKPLQTQRNCGLKKFKAPSTYCTGGDMVHKVLGKSCFFLFVGSVGVECQLWVTPFWWCEGLYANMELRRLIYRYLIIKKYIGQDDLIS